MLTSFEKMSGDKLQKYEYSYDKDGYRTTKKYYEDGILQTETVYMWKDGKLVGSNISDDSGTTLLTIKYIYNGEELVAINLNGGVLLVEKNLQGDITSLYSVDNDEKLFDFYYDAYGNVSFSQENSIIVTIIKALVVILASVAYRGYYYDFDTGLYYLQSRYYDPRTGRFISLDDTQIAMFSVGDPLGLNLYAYCDNDPVNKCDENGYLSYGAQAVAVATMITVYKNSVAAQLFLSGFTKTSQKLIKSKNFNDLLLKRLKQSTAIQNRLNALISMTQRRGSTSGKASYVINFYEYKKNISDVDLLLAIGGGGNISFSIKSKGKKNSKGNTIYSVTLSCKNDSFDFDDFWDNKTKHTKNAIVMLLNNVGASFQKCGAFKSFKWSFTVTYDGYYK